MKAIWNNQLLAESDDTIVIENNHYFPPASLHQQYLVPSKTKTRCHWKGEASYYTLVVDGKENIDAAWFYPQPKEKARQIKDYIAFWKGVEVTE